MTLPTHNHPLQAFDLRSVLLFTCLTVGGSSAVMAQDAVPPSKPLPAITPTEVFQRADTDRNGSLSRAEVAHLPAVAEQFDAWDRNGDGQLSLEEFLLHADRGA